MSVQTEVLLQCTLYDHHTWISLFMFAQGKQRGDYFTGVPNYATRYIMRITSAVLREWYLCMAPLTSADINRMTRHNITDLKWLCYGSVIVTFTKS